jgi:hypothetical protein
MSLDLYCDLRNSAIMLALSYFSRWAGEYKVPVAALTTVILIVVNRLLNGRPSPEKIVK